MPVGVALATLWSICAAAQTPPLTPPQMDQALAIARSSEAARAQFHSAYKIPLDLTAGHILVERLEVITEFRRLVLIGEEHARLADAFGRGGLREAEEALRPWAGRVSVSIHFRLLPTMAYLTGIPLRCSGLPSRACWPRGGAESTARGRALPSDFAQATPRTSRGATSAVTQARVNPPTACTRIPRCDTPRGP